MWALVVCGVLTAALELDRRRSGLSWFDFVERHGMQLFARLWHRCSADGPDPLPAEGPALLIANHPSHADPAFLMATCRRKLCFLQASECYDVFMLRRLFRRAGCIPVKRGGRDVGAIRGALQALRQGSAVCLFPEGEVGGAEATGGRPGKTGAALLALRSGAPVYPARIVGGPRSRSLIAAWLWPSRGVRVIYGPAIDLAAYRGQPVTRKQLREVTGLFEQRLAALRPSPRVREFGVPHTALVRGRAGVSLWRRFAEAWRASTLLRSVAKTGAWKPW